MILFVIFFEWCRNVRNEKMTITRAVVLAIIVLIFYPVLIRFKWIIRASAGVNLSFNTIVDGLIHAFDGVNYFSVIGDGLTHILNRLQVTSIVVEVIRLSDQLQLAFASGKFTPFWMEGLHGITFDRLFYGEKSISIGIFFTSIGDFGWQFEVGDWNTNIGYVGWFFIAPYLIPIYILYTLFLGFVSFFIVKKIGITESAEDMLWFVWLIYLMPPWPAAFVNFIYALVVFLGIKSIFSFIPRIRLFSR